MKIFVDKDKCIGCGACVNNYPSIFTFDDDGLSKVKENQTDEHIEDLSNICPTDAISIEKCSCDNCCCK